jgi:uracil-DNA glycosylase
MHELKTVMLLDSYHCSRYNINTGCLTEEMFDTVMKKVRVALSEGA